MTVVLSLSSVFSPVTVFADSLLGGGTGVSYGVGVNGQWAPIVSKVANTGSQSLYLSHDGTNEITELKMYIQEFGTGTGFTYGGSDTAANDLVTIRGLGQASGNSKNSADGLSGGFWCDMDADVASSNFFDVATRPTQVFIFGNNGTTLATALDVIADSMVYDSGGETVATAPQTGKIGPSGSSTLGDRSHLFTRMYFPDSFSVGGTLQWEISFIYAFSS